MADHEKTGSDAKASAKRADGFPRLGGNDGPSPRPPISAATNGLPVPPSEPREEGEERLTSSPGLGCGQRRPLPHPRKGGERDMRTRDELITQLRASARGLAAASKSIAQGKQGDYEYLSPEQTAEWEAADLIEALSPPARSSEVGERTDEDYDRWLDALEATHVTQATVGALIGELRRHRRALSTARSEGKAEGAREEREACAVVAEQQPATATPGIWSSIQEMHANEIAASIRARSLPTTPQEETKT